MVKNLNLRNIFISAYVLFFASYLVIGIQPAEAAEYEISATLKIPSISLESDVTTLLLDNHRLATPESIVGSFSRNQTTLLIGHSSSVFQNLSQAQINDIIYYNGSAYLITTVETKPKNEINIDQLLLSDDATLILMTCAGEDLGNGDATHRLIITAKKEVL